MRRGVLLGALGAALVLTLWVANVPATMRPAPSAGGGRPTEMMRPLRAQRAGDTPSSGFRLLRSPLSPLSPAWGKRRPWRTPASSQGWQTASRSIPPVAKMSPHVWGTPLGSKQRTPRLAKSLKKHRSPWRSSSASSWSIPSTTTTTTLPTPTTTTSSLVTSSEQAWLASAPVRCILWNESRDEYQIVNYPYSGGFQFLDTTWSAVSGLPGVAADYSPAIQGEMAYRLFLEEGWSPWSTAAGCGV